MKEKRFLVQKFQINTHKISQKYQKHYIYYLIYKIVQNVKNKKFFSCKFITITELHISNRITDAFIIKISSS